jgi:hypothetical protein
VLLGRIELPTSSLPMTRSTTELQQQPFKWAGLCECARHMSSGLRLEDCFGIGASMQDKDNKTREERLAEALRANLRRRKQPGSNLAKVAPRTSPNQKEPQC